MTDDVDVPVASPTGSSPASTNLSSANSSPVVNTSISPQLLYSTVVQSGNLGTIVTTDSLPDCTDTSSNSSPVDPDSDVVSSLPNHFSDNPPASILAVTDSQVEAVNNLIAEARNPVLQSDDELDVLEFINQDDWSSSSPRIPRLPCRSASLLIGLPVWPIHLPPMLMELYHTVPFVMGFYI